MVNTIQSYFWPVFWACVFGVVLLVGLLMEALTDKALFKTINSFRRCHSVKKWGEKLVIIGVLGEVIIAGLTAIRERNNDPWTKPIASSSAKVRIIFKWDKAPQSSDPMLIFKSGEDDSWLAWIRFKKQETSFLQLVSPQGGVGAWNMGSDVKRSCEILFSADPFGFASRDPKKGDISVEKFNEVDSVVMQIRPLATNIVVESGEVQLIVNDLKWTFEIPPQRPKWGLITMQKIKNSAGKTETKVLRTPVKDFVSPPRFPDSWYDGR